MAEQQVMDLKRRKYPKPTAKDAYNPTIVSRNPADYQMIWSFREQPVSDAYLENLAYELIDEVRNNLSSLTIETFLEKKGVCERNFYRWIDRNKYLKDARDYAITCLRNHREIGGLTKRLDPGLVAKTMPMYSDKYKELVTWYEEVKEIKLKNEGVKYIIKHDPRLEIEQKDE